MGEGEGLKPRFVGMDIQQLGKRIVQAQALPVLYVMHMYNEADNWCMTLYVHKLMTDNNK